MEILSSKPNRDLLESLLAEIAKSQNELRCAQRDIEKAQSRIGFAIVLVHELLYREKD